MVCGQIASSSTKPITPCNLNMTRYRGASHSFMFLGSSRYMVVAQTHWPPRIDQNWTLLWVHLSSILPIQTKIPWFRIFAVWITTNAVSGSLPSMKFICFPIFWATELWLVVATVDFPFLNLSNRTSLLGCSLPLWLSRCDAFREFASMCPLSNGSRQNLMNMTFWAKLSGDERAMFLILALGCFGSLRPVLHLAEHLSKIWHGWLAGFFQLFDGKTGGQQFQIIWFIVSRQPSFGTSIFQIGWNH